MKRTDHSPTADSTSSSGDPAPGSATDRKPPPAIASRLGEQIERRLARLLGGQHVFLLVLAALVGIAGGYGAILFRLLIGLINSLAFPGGIALDALYASPWFALVLAPAIGGLFVGPLVHFLAREAKGHGVPEVMDACLNRGGRIRPRVALVKILASAGTIGTGGSVGREGPIVQIGSSIGSSVGQLFGLAGDPLRTLMASGAAAGIAATFNAPIAGFLFATEVILGRGSAQLFSPMVVASVSATVISRLHLGNSPAFAVAPYDLVSPWELLLYLLLGALAALVGVAFTRGLYLIEDAWDRFPLPAYAHGVIGGALVGLLACAFPQVMGVGYEHIEEVLRGQLFHHPTTIWGGTGILLLLVALKIAATGTTIGSGGSGGIFAPSLFMGASLGGAFGAAANALLPAGAVAGPGAYALVAMGAVVAATTHAPLTAILIVFELTDRHTIILPLMLSCIISSVLAMWLKRESIYTMKLLRRGSRLRRSLEEQVLAGTEVQALVRPPGDTLRPQDPLAIVVEQVVETHHPLIYVTSEEGLLLGEIHLEDVASILRDEHALGPLLVAADLLRAPAGAVRPTDTLEHSLARFAKRQVEELPVVDEAHRLLGRISRADVIALYDREVLHGEAMLHFVATSPENAAVEELVHLPPGEVREELPVTGGLAGRTLRELDLRARFGVSVYAVREVSGETCAPLPDRPLSPGQLLEVHGPAEGMARLRAVFELEQG